MPGPRLDQGAVEETFGEHAVFLGGGSFGDTWCVGSRAEKILCGEPVDDARFGREVEALGRLNHPRVVRLHEVRSVVIAGTTYRSMSFDYVAGVDVAEALADDRVADVEEVEPLLVGLLEAVEAMHAVRVLHRDIKPANVILRAGIWADPVLCDLGLARLADVSSITMYPAQVGTIPYMAPEQLEGRRATKGGDLWSVGVLVRETITGRHPFFKPGEQLDGSRFDTGPVGLPDDLDPHLRRVLDDLTSVQRHRRGTARSNLRRIRNRE